MPHRAALAWRGPSATTNFPKDNYDLAAIATDIELSRDGPQPNASRSTRRSKHGSENGKARSSKGNAADDEPVRCALAVHESASTIVDSAHVHVPPNMDADVLMSCQCPAGRHSKLPQ